MIPFRFSASQFIEWKSRFVRSEEHNSLQSCLIPPTTPHQWVQYGNIRIISPRGCQRKKLSGWHAQLAGSKLRAKPGSRVIVPSGFTAETEWLTYHLHTPQRGRLARQVPKLSMFLIMYAVCYKLPINSHIKLSFIGEPDANTANLIGSHWLNLSVHGTAILRYLFCITITR